jgi:hypothetical protein
VADRGLAVELAHLLAREGFAELGPKPGRVLCEVMGFHVKKIVART